jgi:hypothetical protein
MACLLVTLQLSGQTYNFTPPTGYAPFNLPKQPRGCLFSGQKTNSAGVWESLMVFHANEAKERSGARDLIGAYIDRFWKADRAAFMRQNLSTVEIASHTLLVQTIPPAPSGPKSSGETSFVMTEDGVFLVFRTARDESSFDIKGFLNSSLRITSKDATFSKELANYWIKALSDAQTKIRNGLDPDK